MKKETPTPVHAWLVMMKAMQAISAICTGKSRGNPVGLSDFAVLEAVLHKGPAPRQRDRAEK